MSKGDVLEVARLAGIMGAKRTADLIPLCHPLALSSIAIDLQPVFRHGVGGFVLLAESMPRPVSKWKP